MVFAVGRLAGWLDPSVRVDHLAFGSVLGEDSRMLRTRRGESVKLTDLLDEAVTRAAELVARKSPGLAERERAEVATAVGIGAVKYADLSTDLVNDYVFDLDRMVSFTGDTGVYLQYAHARIQAVLRRAQDGTGPVATAPVDGSGRDSAGYEPAERILALALLTFPDAVDAVAAQLRPHLLARHLREVAVAFTAFYEACPVLRAEAGVRHRRLILCRAAARVLAQGLHLLGIAAPDRL
jgi:arginyl-tRNA synthetase